MFWEKYRALRELRDEIQRVYALAPADEKGGRSFVVPTLTGREVVIEVSERKGWRTLMSAMWSTVEAEIMDLVLIALPDVLRPFDAKL